MKFKDLISVLLWNSQSPPIGDSSFPIQIITYTLDKIMFYLLTNNCTKWFSTSLHLDRAYPTLSYTNISKDDYLVLVESFFKTKLYYIDKHYSTCHRCTATAWIKIRSFNLICFFSGKLFETYRLLKFLRRSVWHARSMHINPIDHVWNAVKNPEYVANPFPRTLQD